MLSLQLYAGNRDRARSRSEGAKAGEGVSHAQQREGATRGVQLWWLARAALVVAPKRPSAPDPTAGRGAPVGSNPLKAIQEECLCDETFGRRMALIASFSIFARKIDGRRDGSRGSAWAPTVDRATGALPPVPAVYPILGLFRNSDLEHEYLVHLCRSTYKQIILVT